MLTYIADYTNADQQVLTVGKTESSLPTLLAGGTVLNPERIFVQASPNNTANIYIGKTGVQYDDSTGAFVIPPGSSVYLPSHNRALWKCIAGVVAQKLHVTYLSKGT